jgi:hypothetical protein
MGFKLGARDGEIGKVKDFYFDDQSWTVRYLIADTGKWLPGRLVLISPFAVKGVKEQGRDIEVDLSKEQIEESPSIDTDMPVSRQYEIKYYGYYGWPMYWYGPELWGPSPFPGGYASAGFPPEPQSAQVETQGDPHLRSIREMTGYHIQAHDDEIGHIDDWILDDADWAIRYLAVDTRNWWPGKKVLLAPQWITSVSWHQSKIFVALDRDTIRQAPEYDESVPITREYESRLYNHYNRNAYWTRSAKVTAGR